MKDDATTGSPCRATVAIDGSCRTNPGPGGWAAVIDEDGIQRVLTGRQEITTDNRLKLTAIIEALRSFDAGAQLTMLVESAYIMDGLTRWADAWHERRWRTSSGRPVANADLWQTLLAEIGRHHVTWQSAGIRSIDQQQQKGGMA